MAGIKRGADEIARGRHGVIVLGLDERELFALFGLELAFGRGGFGQHLEEEIEAGFPIGTEELERKRGAVVAGIGMERAAELLDVAGQLLRIAMARALDEQVRGEAADAILALGLGHQSAGEGGTEREERQRVLRHVEAPRAPPSEIDCGTGRAGASRASVAAEGFSTLGTSETRFSRSE